jgi:chromosome segregation protein
MRLEKIKLAGFKSFVDPTSVPTPSNLVGIVGPNGCGKSNVIDAVRWVMGESSAKMLRGESMADVIFNGSSSRKPVGQASIELLFDNTEGRAGGEYAQYNQISVKRQVSRDGQSNYSLNGVRCRRRDITDLFLGTGLGPRSYSIIEQGMISRLIEARPEELRVFLEEAAGISKYKERRKETENRIRHTRENLERLTDLRDEVAKQLQHLKRQAATAEKYQVLKQEERQVKAELLSLRWQTLELDLEKRDRVLGQQGNQLEAVVAEQRKLESQIEEEREKHTEANDLFNEVQGRFYAVGAEITGLEQAIQYARDSRHRQEQDLREVEQVCQESEDQRAQDQARLEELQDKLSQETPRLEQAQAEEKALAETLSVAQGAIAAWQNEWDKFNHEAAQPAQTAQVERTRLNHLEQQEANLRKRLERLNGEMRGLDDSSLKVEIGQLEQQEANLQQQLQEQKQQLQEAVDGIGRQREENSQLMRQLDQAKSALRSAQGRHASLEALQQAALGAKGNQIPAWLEQRNLTQASRLAQELKVEPRWQHAVEIVLGYHLQAVCVDDLEAFKEEITRLENGVLTLWDTRGGEGQASGDSDDSLQNKIQAPWPLGSLLGGIKTAENLQQAINQRRELGPGESILTPEGYWVGANWMRVTRQEDEKAGVLAREQELRQLTEELERLESQVGSLAESVRQGQQKLEQAEQTREALQGAFNKINRELSGIHSSLSGKRTRSHHLQQRREQLQQEQAEINEQVENGQQQMAEAKQKLHSALEAIETLSASREALVQRRDHLREQAKLSQERLDKQRESGHQVALQVEAMRAAHESLEQNLQRLQSQLKQLQERRGSLQEQLAGSEAPLRQQQTELETKLTQRASVEQELAMVRGSLEEIDRTLREQELERHRREQQVQEQRNQLDQGRLARQEVHVRLETVAEELDEQGVEAQALLREMPEEASEKAWKERLDTLGARIQRLGAINLAAIDEYQEQSERLGYLDDQHADITQSLDTLENAIRRIDRETRTRFKETFEQVNSGIKELFPRLFGGGHAYLQLTGEDLLDTGVTVMARPPGKRNSSIQLLSGGEKALTAVALVFSIFQLNPAPFCMLDEVDAPLDDANVGRFCEMVKSMSDQVQFIFITHNKITMEIANQLSGVTMHEPGVSRLVTVDVEEAAKIAAL